MSNTEGTTEPEYTGPTLPLEQALNLTFASGVGAWGTVMTLCPDGTFFGDFSDSEMGVVEEDYPNGIRWICSFSGAFEDFVQVDANIYKLTLTHIETANAEGQEWIEDGVKYIAAGPYGLQDGTEFYLYLPSTPVDAISEEMLSWWPDRFGSEEGTPTTLGRYGLYNAATGHTFFSAKQ